MNIEQNTKHEKMLRLNMELILAEKNRLVGISGYTIDEANDILDKVINADQQFE